MRVTGSTCWVPPFGNPWIIAYLQLPKAYRRLSRPSSAEEGRDKRRYALGSCK